MADESENFVIKVVADVQDAAKGFDQLLRMVDEVAVKAGTGLKGLERAVGATDSSFLKMAASMTPLGRAATSLVAALDGAVAVGRKLAEQFGGDAEKSLGAFTTAL